MGDGSGYTGTLPLQVPVRISLNGQQYGTIGSAINGQQYGATGSATQPLITFYEPPVLSSVQPSGGPAAGGTQVE